MPRAWRLQNREHRLTNRQIQVYIDPPTHHFLGDRLFQENGAVRLNGDQQEAPYVHLRDHFARRGIEVHTADMLPSHVDESTRKVYFSLGRTYDAPRLVRRPDVDLGAFLALECPIVEPSLYKALPRMARHFPNVYSWSDSTSLERFTGRALKLRHFYWPQSFDDVHSNLWHQTDRKSVV